MKLFWDGPTNPRVTSVLVGCGRGLRIVFRYDDRPFIFIGIG